MSPLDAYLRQHYLPAAQFAALCDVPVETLAMLVGERRIPAPSYLVTSDAMLRSSPFGDMPAPGSTPGEYFHPGHRAWVHRALELRDVAALKERFSRNFASALAQLHATLWPLTDSFTASGVPIASGLAVRLEDAWDSFLDGTFGVCVADPSSESSIATKEVLQEKLSAVTRNGADACPDGLSRDALLALVADYASAAMPFSPVEYPRSSRKRLVDDLRRKLGAM
jgi:hypothetical protein